MTILMALHKEMNLASDTGFPQVDQSPGLTKVQVNPLLYLTEKELSGHPLVANVSQVENSGVKQINPKIPMITYLDKYDDGRDELEEDHGPWYVYENGGISRRCKTCLTVVGSLGEAKSCSCEEHKKAMQ